MTILWINLAIVFICSFIARYYTTPIPVSITLPVVRPSKSLILIALLSVILVAGLRANIGDTYFYKHAFEVSEYNWNEIEGQKNVGFWLLQKFIKSYSSDPQLLLLTIAAITNILIFIGFYKYSRLFELSTYVYITGGMYLVSMNGMRQVFTAAILFAGTKYLMQRNWIKYLLLVLFASSFHESALILVPIYFFVRYKAWSKATIVLLLFAVLIVVGFDQFSSILFSAIEETQYGHYKDFQEGGANIIRVAVNAVPLFIAYLGRDRLREIFPESDYIVNMSLLGFAFMLISSQNWIFARFALYFIPYQILLVSWIVKLFKEREQRLVYFGILVCYFLYYYYESVISLNIIYRSDYFSL